MVSAANLPPLNVVQIGNNGPPLLMLHGWGQSLNSLRPLGQLLSAYRKVYLIDLPGFGASPRPSEDWSTVEYAQRILQYIDDNNIECVDLLGHSFGGRICIRLASRYPNRFGRMVLIDAGGLQRALPISQIVRSYIVRDLRWLVKRLDMTFKTRFFDTWFVPRFASYDYLNAGAMRNTLVKTVNEDLSNEAAQITIPTLILWGDQDTETPPEMARRLHQYISNSELIFLPGKDHFPFLGEGAHLCASYIRQFLLSEINVSGLAQCTVAADAGNAVTGDQDSGGTAGVRTDN